MPKFIRAISIAAVCVGCFHSYSPYDSPRDVWMTHWDGGVPCGQNSYWDASDDIRKGDEFAARYADYAFISVAQCGRALDRDIAVSAMVGSVEQCRRAFGDAYMSRTLRQIDSLHDVGAKSRPAVFRPHKIVVLIYSERVRGGVSEFRSEAAFGAVLRIEDVFDERKTAEAVVNRAFIVKNPKSIVETGIVEPGFSIWEHTRFEVIDAFEEKYENVDKE